MVGKRDAMKSVCGTDCDGRVTKAGQELARSLSACRRL